MQVRKFSWKQSFFWIFCSTLLISGTMYAFFFGYRKYDRSRRANPANNITTILQTGPQQEALKTVFLAELMGLSIDNPINIYAFDIKEAEKKLLLNPVIKKAQITKIFPSTIYVDYSVRIPVARLSDFANTALDKEGIVFPLAPFFSPKSLPEIYLGMDPNAFKTEEIRYGHMLQNKKLKLAYKLLWMLSEQKVSFHIRKIDVSKAFSESYGQREIVVQIDDELLLKQGEREVTFLFPKYLRLGSRDFEQQLGNYLVLREKMLEDYRKQLSVSEKTPDLVKYNPRTINLRIPQLAFINEND